MPWSGLQYACEWVQAKSHPQFPGVSQGCFGILPGLFGSSRVSRPKPCLCTTAASAEGCPVCPGEAEGAEQPRSPPRQHAEQAWPRCRVRTQQGLDCLLVPPPLLPAVPWLPSAACCSPSLPLCTLVLSAKRGLRLALTSDSQGGGQS